MLRGCCAWMLDTRMWAVLQSLEGSLAGNSLICRKEIYHKGILYWTFPYIVMFYLLFLLRWFGTDIAGRLCSGGVVPGC